MMAKFAEDDRIEQMNANKRRMKQLEHKRAVEKLIDDRKVQFAADRERELEERREEERMEAFRKQIIEEERQKLLREHAMRLLGYLPKVKLRAQRGSAGPWERGGGEVWVRQRGVRGFLGGLVIFMILKAEKGEYLYSYQK